MANGYSLHIGLNHVNPKFYAGCDGKLNCCVNDANAMLKIAVHLKYSERKTLFDSEATRENLINTLSDYSSKMQPGDILFLTYSGHGSSVRDVNGDEKLLDPHDTMDETWCLYNGFLIDDELYELYSKFKNGVRIVVISDSCHSGSVVRGEDSPEDLEIDLIMKNSGYVEKMLPKKIGGITYKRSKKYYDKLQKKINIHHSEIGASIILLSGCQDNQKSYEGKNGFGVLTERIIHFWDNGNFNKNYNRFLKEIQTKMPRNQSPNLYITGKKNQVFLNQIPFTI